MAPKFTRTYTAAQIDIQSKWELIEAIADDAIEAEITISGIESRVAAKDALRAAGSEYTDHTVTHLCLLAKFDSESTAKQRRVWRRYGWTVVYAAANAGWSQEAVYDLLIGEHKTIREVQAAINRKVSASRKRNALESIDARWAKWLSKFGTLIEEGAELAEETDAADVTLGGYGQLGYLMYERAVSDGLDAEYRELIETAEAE